MDKSINNIATNTPRKKILDMNNDLLFGVYSIIEKTINSIQLQLIKNVFTTYPGRIISEKINGLQKNISILDLPALRKKEIKVLYGDRNLHIKNPTLLSGGVVEFIKSQDTKEYIFSTIRDGHASDPGQRTTIAGRNSGDDLEQDFIEEYVGESPFLGYNKNNELALAIPETDNPEKAKQILSKSINFFLKNQERYLSYTHPNYQKAKKIFESNFPNIQYHELKNILKTIINQDNINTYTSETAIIHGLESDIKTIKLGNSVRKYFVFCDEEHNTIEYRKLQTITGFNDGFKPLSEMPSRLYLEGQYQYPKLLGIEDSQDKKNKYVPTLNYIIQKIRLK